MSEIEKIRKAVGVAQTKLTNKAMVNGIHENFGQKEVQKIMDKFNYNVLVYGTTEQRLAAKLIDNFDNWCTNYHV